MTVTLYKYTGENNRLDKTSMLSGALQRLNVKIKGNFDAVSPELIFDYSGELDGYNYLLCDFGNGAFFYYYCTIIATPGQMFRAVCKRDPFMSFKSQMLASKAVARRTKNPGTTDNINLFVNDPDLPMFAYTEDTVHVLGSFTNMWTGGAYVCTVG